jgi:uncharacterized protein (DUF488 family)
MKVKELWTIGHSRQRMEEFLGLLGMHQIEVVADVRRFPISVRFPHFSQMQLFKSLAKAGIDYEAFSELGGRRRAQPDSPNTLWRNESFRAYADYMMTRQFQGGIERLLQVAGRKRTAILCAEALWWHCHRALIADYLKNMGVKVIHIYNTGKAEEHSYTSAARIVNGKLTYAPAELALK